MYRQYMHDDKKELYLEDFWRRNWESFSLDALTKSLDQNELWRIIKRYLPRDGRILEGGCGLGHWVKFLRSQNYDIVGIENVKETVLRAKEIEPSLPVYPGDVTNLDFTENAFDAYLSLGVIEHFEEGPQKALEEAKRILKTGGRLLVSVPYMNVSKKVWQFMESFPGNRTQVDGRRFYQYVFQKNELRKYLWESGFKVIALYEYAADTGLQNRIPLFGKIKEMTKAYKSESSIKQKIYPFLRKVYFQGIRFIPKNIFAHMILAVCINNK